MFMNRLLLGVSLGMAGFSANATVLLIDVGGSIGSYFTIATGQQVDEQLGAAFSARLVLDLSHGQSFYQSDADGTVNRTESQTGCAEMQGAACNPLYTFTDSPVTTSFQVTVNGVRYDALPDAANETSLQKSISAPDDGSFHLFSGQRRANFNAMSSFVDQTTRTLLLSVQGGGGASWLNVGDLADLGSLLPQGIGFTFEDSRMDCTLYAPFGRCEETAYRPGSFYATGLVTSFTVTDISPSAQVPEPGALALVGLGLAGLVAVRRRRT